MTCIVGFRTTREVVIGGDSAGVSGWDLNIRADPKVFRLESASGDYILGFSDCFRFGQILNHEFKPPPYKGNDENESLRHYMATDFIGELQKTLRHVGYQPGEGHRGGSFLVGFRRHLYRVCSDFQVAENLDAFDAIGCGGQVALGCLYGIQEEYKCRTINPLEAVRQALRAAEHFNAGVRAPFIFETLSYE